MKTETASPRPWRLRFNAPCLIEPNEDDTRRAKIARTDCSHGIGDAGERDKANAEFIVRAVNAHDALVEALERVSNGISDNSTLVYSAVEHCQRHNTSEPMVGVLELRRVVATALALAKEGKIEKGKQ